jgi:outer membrane lipoprotein-sorting protein
MTLLILAGLLVQDSQAEETFRKIEEEFVQAKAVRADFSVDLGAGEKGRILLLIKEPNKVVLDMTFPVEGKKPQRAFIHSDGTALIVKSRSFPQTHRRTLPKTLGFMVKAALLRAGFAGLDYLTDELFHAPEGTEVVLEPKENLELRRISKTKDPNRTFNYDLTFKGFRIPKGEPVFQATSSVSLQIRQDVLHFEKRTLRAALSDLAPQKISEEYREVTTAQEIQDENFQFPDPKEPTPVNVRAMFSRMKGTSAVKDHSPLDSEDGPYSAFLQTVSKLDPLLITKDAAVVDYSSFASDSTSVRGQPIRLQLHFLGTYPTKLKGELPFVHRTYLSTLDGSEGYVVDLLDSPPELTPRTLVTLEAVFFKIGTYEGRKGPIEAPFLIGQRLRSVLER